MEIEFLNCHRGEHLVQFDTDTPEGRAKLAEEFQRLVKCGTGIFLERAGKEGPETLRVTGYDPATDTLHVEMPDAGSREVYQASDDDDDLIMSDIETRKEQVPESLRDRKAKVGDHVSTKGRGRRRYEVKKVDPKSGHIVAVAPVSGG
jgi:hypothetical protein